MTSRRPSQSLPTATALPAPVSASDAARLWTAPFVRLLVVQTCFGLSFSVFFLLPKFLAGTGAGPSEIGVIMSLWGVAGVVASPIVGTLLDRMGRKPFIVAGTVLMAVGAFGFTAVEGYGPLAILFRLAQGTAFAFVFNGVMTAVADRVPRERMGQALGLAGTAALLTNAVAPAAVEPLADAHGWTLGFALAGSAALVAVAMAVRVQEPPRAAGGGNGGGWLTLLRRPVAQAVAFAAVTCGVGFGALASFHQPFALELGIERVGGFFVAYTIAASIVRIGFGGVIDRLGTRRMALVSLFTYAGVVAGGAELGLFGLELLGAGLGFAHGAFFPALAGYVMEHAAVAERGRTMALLHTAFNGGLGASVVLLGVLAEQAGYPSVFLSAGAVVLVGFVVLRLRAG